MQKGDADVGDDADMGDWNESNSVWSSAAGFKQPRKHVSAGTVCTDRHL